MIPLGRGPVNTRQKTRAERKSSIVVIRKAECRVADPLYSLILMDVDATDLLQNGWPLLIQMNTLFRWATIQIYRTYCGMSVTKGPTYCRFVARVGGCEGIKA